MKEEVRARIASTAAILGLEVLMDRKPPALSGGQRQRVAMGHAMVRRPDVFLFDEPLSNLDAKLRTQVRLEIGKLHKRPGTTVLYVIHRGELRFARGYHRATLPLPAELAPEHAVIARLGR